MVSLLQTGRLVVVRFIARSHIDVAYLEKVAFFYNFCSFGGIRSTQPTGRYGFFLN